MKIIAVVSAKGGVGKTTLTANLGVGIAQRSLPVLLLDLDPQNSLQWHLGGVPPEDTEGLSSATSTRLFQFIYTSPFGVDFVPYGIGNEVLRQKFEATLEQQDDWLLRQLRAANLPAETIVVIDTPPGPSPYLKQVLQIADLVLVVVLADMASYVTIVEMENLLQTYSPHGLARSRYVVNQSKQNELSQEIINSMRQNLGSRVAPCVIPEQEQVEEALAYERPILQYEPQNPASLQIQGLLSYLFGR